MAKYGYNYLQPTPPKRLRRQVAQSVNAQIAPYLKQITRAEQQGAGQIGVYSDQLAHSLLDAQRTTRENYGQAEASQAAINTALANRLSGAGNAVSNDLAGQLSAAGQSTAPSSAVGAIGSGASNAGYASGSASLSALLAQGAAAQQYAGQLPNLARMQGIQQQGLFTQQQEKSRADLLAKVPGLIDSEQKQALANEFQKAVAQASGLIDQQKLNETSAYHAASIQVREDAINASNKRARAAINARANSQGRTYDNNLSRSAGHAVDKQGRPIINPATGRPFKYVAPPRSSGGPTQAQLTKTHNYALEATKALKHGVANPYYDPNADKNNPSYHKGVSDAVKTTYPTGTPATRQRALKYLINHKVPRDMAMNIIGKVYGPVR